jgi:hypothetical protein
MALRTEAEKQADEWSHALKDVERKATQPPACRYRLDVSKGVVASMIPTQSQIADFWCKLMHKEPMWPSHGKYQCRTCGRRHRVSWDEPLPAAGRAIALPDQACARGTLEIGTESRIQCS